MKLSDIKYLLIIFFLFTAYACNDIPEGEVSESGVLPALTPDYTFITIPGNIAPLNFRIDEPGTKYYVEISSGEGTLIKIKSMNGSVKIPLRKWKKLMGSKTASEINLNVFVKNDDRWKKFKTIINGIAPEPIDPFLTYRLLHPGYESWAELSINERDLVSFREKPLIENGIADDNCVNCHSYNNGRTNDFLFHMRGNLGGTYFYSDGNLNKINLKAKEMLNGAVYPRWHPSGKYVAFSSNKIVQQFHSADNKKVEVIDLESSLVLYDVGKNEMTAVPFQQKEMHMDTYPEWSPDGRFLYFCRTEQIGDEYDYSQIRYNLWKVAFDPESRKFGEAEIVYDASAICKSISFPRISPDGRFLVMTMQDYGCFPIWHKETDLYCINLDSLSVRKLGLNSEYTDSYHSWSSNGRWLVFSSRRGDGLTTRPYISYINHNGVSDKPFILPQKEPQFYDEYPKSFNIPEFSNISILINPGKIRKKVRSTAIETGWSEN